jgi:hypothetical protein
VATKDAVIGLTHGILVIFGQSIQGRLRIVEVGESDPDNLVFVLKNLVHQVSEVIFDLVWRDKQSAGMFDSFLY